MTTIFPSRPFWTPTSTLYSTSLFIPKHTQPNFQPRTDWFTPFPIYKLVEPTTHKVKYKWKQKETLGENERVKVAKIRIIPTEEQREKLIHWSHCTRKTYNLCVAFVNERQGRNKQPTRMTSAFETEMRQSCVGKNGQLKENEMLNYLLDVPQPIRDNALRDVKKSVKAHYKKKGQNRPKCFHLHFRSIKNERFHSVFLPKREWSLRTGKIRTLMSNVAIDKKYSKYPKGSYIQEELINKNLTTLPADSRLLINHNYTKFDIYIPIPIESKDMKVKKRIIALDPGVRTFLTGYNQKGQVIEYGGSKDNAKLFKTGLLVDKLMSRSKRKKGKQSRRRHRRAAQRLRDKIKNRVNYLHKCVSKDLLENNRVILLPSFNVQNMVSKKQSRRLLPRSTVRQMLSWSHFKFRQYLITKSREYPHSEVRIVTEEYTSKTCGCCGEIHHLLGGAKTFTCPSCNFTISRDWNGARNILIKYMTENPEQFKLKTISQ